MGSISWCDDFLQGLLTGLVVQIVVNVLCALWAVLWASWKEWIARPPTGESMAESDVEMGTVNVGEGATIPGIDNTHGLAVNLGVVDDDKLEHTEDMADTRAGTPEARISTPKAQCKNVTEDVNRRA